MVSPAACEDGAATPRTRTPHVATTAARTADLIIDPPPTAAPARAATVSRLTGGTRNCGQLTTRGVDLPPPRVAHGCPDAVAAENSDELPLDLGVGRRPDGARRGVQRDHVDVNEMAPQQHSERVRAFRLVVDV